MTEKLTIRIAQEQDVGIIAKIHVSCWQEVYSSFLPPEVIAARPYEHRFKQWTDWFDKSDDGSRLSVVEDEGKIIAFCFCLPNDEAPPAKSEIHAVYVQHEYRKSYAGPLMVASMVRYLIGVDLMPIKFSVFKDNPYRRWHSMMGWKPYELSERIISGFRIPEYQYRFDEPEKVLRRLENIVLMRQTKIPT